MAKGKGGLGRGLESLFEDAAPSLESDAKIETLPLREIVGSSPFQRTKKAIRYLYLMAFLLFFGL